MRTPTSGGTRAGERSAPRDVRDPEAPWVYWYWMYSAYSAEGVSADLEAMAHAGVAGAYLMPVKGAQDPPLVDPPVRQGSEEWWGLVRHAMEEAGRLGLQLAMHACDGFAVAGGPWITPELSMQRVTWAERVVEGGTEVGSLPLPPRREGYYRDIRTFAMPAREWDRPLPAPVVRTAAGDDAGFLLDPSAEREVRLDEGGWVELTFPAPVTLRSVRVAPGLRSHQPQRMVVLAGDDELATVARLRPARAGWQDDGHDYTHALPQTTARRWRFVHDPDGTEPGSEDLDAAKWAPTCVLRGLTVSARPVVDQVEGKSGAVWRIAPETPPALLPDAHCYDLDEVVDVSAHLDAQGTLRWTPPPGRWRVVRIGHTSTGKRNETAGGAQGLEADKFSARAARLQFDRWFGRAVRTAGEPARQVLTVFHVDSWECGSQNWSPGFADEFARRRGYDLHPWLPVLAGIPLASARACEQVLHDVRETIAELVVDVFFATMADRAHAAGTAFSSECVAPTMVSDGLAHFREVDLPAGEFWLRSPTHDKPTDMRDAISAARVYGRRVVQAEAFTQLRIDWDEHPGTLKALGDLHYALGANRFFYHVFVHNPWLDRAPGMTLDNTGTVFQRDQPWWSRGAPALVGYHRRVQGHLQRGDAVVDVAVFTGEEVPRRSVLPERLAAVLPGLVGPDRVEEERVRLANEGRPLRRLPQEALHSAHVVGTAEWVDPLRGYAYDSVNPDALLRLARVTGGRVAFPGGASYAVLVVPGPGPMTPTHVMSTRTARRLAELRDAGATVLLGERPVRSPGREDPAAWQAAVDALWGDGDEGRSLPWSRGDLRALGVEPDVLFHRDARPGQEAAAGDDGPLAWTHRRDDAGDLYFLSNQAGRTRRLVVSLRGTGRVPELHDPLAGTVRDADGWWTAGGRTFVPLTLAGAGSVVVRLDRAGTPGPAVDPPEDPAEEPDGEHTELRGPWTVSFVSAGRGPAAARELPAPVVLPELVDLATHPDRRVRHHAGTATYRTRFAAHPDGRTVLLDLGALTGVARVRVNGVPCGTVWTPPLRADVTGALHAGTNTLEVEVAGTWAPRMIGDATLPEQDRVSSRTAPSRLDGLPLPPAGLRGPVRLVPAPQRGLT